jgi:pectate lyase
MSLQVKESENVIIKNLSVVAPNDLFPEWDPTDGIKGSWNSEYDAIVISNSTNVWVDNCYLSDGKKTIDTTPFTFGKYIELHDGLLDVVNAADLVTISNNRFENHQKTSLIGNSDSKTTDRGHLRVTIYNNVFVNCDERLPRVRFGKVHVFNNFFYSETFNVGYPALTVKNYFHDDTVFPQYMIGLGVESDVLSERNSFNYGGNNEIKPAEDIVVYSYGGHIFHDNGSEFNGKKLDFDTLAKESFKLKVKTKMAQNAVSGKKNPVWVNATFTTETFEPREYYDYELLDIDSVNDLINKVPTWMFNGYDEIETEVITETVTVYETEAVNDTDDSEDSAEEVDDVEADDAEDSAEEVDDVETDEAEDSADESI